MNHTATTTKQDFANFLTDNREHISYDNKLFTKDDKPKIIKILVDDKLIYEIHKEKRLLIVTDALYCTFNRDEYWDLAKLADLEEVIADPDTLIRI